MTAPPRESERPSPAAPQRGRVSRPRGRLPPRELVVAAALALAVGLLFAPSLGYGFLRLDDEPYVVANPHLSGSLSRDFLGWAFTTDYGAMWQPLTWISYAIDVRIHGLSAAGFHLTNVFLHGTSAGLLFLYFARATGATLRSAFAAALFAFHPQRVESVVWIAERKGLLAGLFWVLALLAYLPYVRRRSLAAYGGVIAAHSCALMSKPTALMFPFVLLLLDGWPLGRWGDPALGTTRGERARRLIVEKLPLVALSAIGAALAYRAQRAAGALDALGLLAFGDRLANALISTVAYLRDFLWPARLGLLYPHPLGAPPGVELAAALVVLGGTTWLVLRRGRGGPLVTGWLWFLIALLPASGLVQTGTQARADRYTYLPAIGLALIVAWGVPAALSRAATRLRLPARARRFGIPTLALATIAACVTATTAQILCWKSPVDLFRRTLAVTPPNFLIEHELAVELEARGEPAEALDHYRRAVEIRPSQVTLRQDFASALARAGQLTAAASQYEAALRLAPADALTLAGLGSVRAQLGDLKPAAALLERALALDPAFVEARWNLARIRMDRGQWPEAEDELERLLAARPGDLEARRALDFVRRKSASSSR